MEKRNDVMGAASYRYMLFRFLRMWIPVSAGMTDTDIQTHKN